MSITEFLTARWDEEEAAGCGCETNEAGDIRCHRCGERVNVRCWNCRTPRGSGPCPTPRSARALALIAAKRSILALHEPKDRRPWGVGNGWQECTVCFDPGTQAGDYDFETWPCPTLRALVQPYADHPDFDESWKP